MFEFQLSREFKRRKVNLHFKGEIEPHETLLDKLARKKEKETGLSEKKFEVPLSQKILQGLWIISLILILIIFGKTFQLQVLEGKELSALSEGNKFLIRSIQAERGVIYDKDGNQLVFNKPSFDLILDKRFLPQDENEKTKVLKKISEIIGKDFDDFKKEIEESPLSQVLVSENLSHEILVLLEARIEEFPGFQVEHNTIRDFEEGEDFAHLIGYTGKIKTEEIKAEPEVYSIFDYVGRDGLEKSYEQVLRKNSGKLRIERDALGSIISKEIISLPESGKSLVLWLDSGLQKKIKEELERKIRELGVKKAVAVALDPKTGGVLSMVSLPSFDSDLFQKGANPEELLNLLKDPLNSLFNRVISGIGYPTGSTIKPLIASAALQEKIISPQKDINCQGEIVVENPWYDPQRPELRQKEWIYHDWMTHGLTDLRKAIAESCNVYFYTLGGGYKNQEGLGATRIEKYLGLFGWGEKTGIDLPGEGEGILPKIDENWLLGDTYHLSIGQGAFAITPLQAVNAFSAIANGGKLFQPQVVQKIVDGEKNLIEEIKPEIVRENFIDPENLQVVREGMRDAVIYGSAAILNSLPVKAAAKTGTAETQKENYYHNWVTVFAPYEDPQIVLTIMIENVSGMQAAVLPVAKEVLNWYFTREHNF